MSAANPRFTVTGHGRTFADRAPYLKPQFWADPANHFWESPKHSEKSKEYFRGNLARILADVHNLVRIENSQQKS